MEHKYPISLHDSETFNIPLSFMFIDKRLYCDMLGSLEYFYQSDKTLLLLLPHDKLNLSSCIRFSHTTVFLRTVLSSITANFSRERVFNHGN